MEVSKHDWMLYKNKIGEWQEKYIQELNDDYIRILNSNDAPSKKFWELDERIRKDKRSKGVRIQLSKADMPYDVAELLNQGVIVMSDIDEFSDDFKETIRFLLQRQR